MNRFVASGVSSTEEAPMAPAQNTTGWILSVAARSKCPRCGQGRLFNGFLTFAKKCDVCGLDYAFADTADGPAFFAMMGMGVPVTAFGIWTLARGAGASPDRTLAWAQISFWAESS